MRLKDFFKIVYAQYYSIVCYSGLKLYKARLYNKNIQMRSVVSEFSVQKQTDKHFKNHSDIHVQLTYIGTIFGLPQVIVT